MVTFAGYSFAVKRCPDCSESGEAGRGVGDRDAGTTRCLRRVAVQELHAEPASHRVGQMGITRSVSVAAGLAERCVIQLSYAIGVAKPLSVYVDTYGTNTVDEMKLSTVIQEIVDLSPRGIREHLKLSQPIYARTSAYGHFGRSPDKEGGFSWEKIDLVDELRGAFV